MNDSLWPVDLLAIEIYNLERDLARAARNVEEADGRLRIAEKEFEYIALKLARLRGEVK